MYIAILGQTPDLAYQELVVVLERQSVTAVSRLKSHLAQIDAPTLDADQLIKTLGGTVKISQQLEGASEDAVSVISTDLKTAGHKPAFIISSYNPDIDTQTLCKQVKQALSAEGFSSRFRHTKSPLESAGVLTDYSEYHIIGTASEPIVTKVVAVQSIDRWNRKDYGRPNVDPKSGMLPPKIARIMVNLGLANNPTTDTKVYDPFCGSGTVLMEALDLGVSVFGSDVSTQAITDSNANIDWYKSQFHPKGEHTIFTADATHVSQKEGVSALDAIVFEGYLGPAVIPEAKMPNQLKGLGKLYKGVFKNLSHLLKPGGRLVAALPQYHMRTDVKNLDSLVDECENFGYTQLCSPITYGREHAVVKRRIYLLQKTA